MLAFAKRLHFLFSILYGCLNEKILVTGSSGLIGSSIAERLVLEGYKVLDCDIRFKDNPIDFSSSRILDLLQECSGIIHLATISRVIHGETHSDLCQKINVDSNEKFISMIKKLPNKPWFIYGSSREVYGNQKELPVIESRKLLPMNNFMLGVR